HCEAAANHRRLVAAKELAQQARLEVWRPRKRQPRLEVIPVPRIDVFLAVRWSGQIDADRLVEVLAVGGRRNSGFEEIAERDVGLCLEPLFLVNRPAKRIA